MDSCEIFRGISFIFMSSDATFVFLFVAITCYFRDKDRQQRRSHLAANLPAGNVTQC